MTENEAIIWLEDDIKEIKRDLASGEVSNGYAEEGTEIYKMAISALKEIQQYREIGTVEECREAREKQTQKVLKFYGDGEEGLLLCPNCNGDVWDLMDCGFDFCPYCGQAIQWGENLEGMEDE